MVPMIGTIFFLKKSTTYCWGPSVSVLTRVPALRALDGARPQRHAPYRQPELYVSVLVVPALPLVLARRGKRRSEMNCCMVGVTNIKGWWLIVWCSSQVHVD